MRIQRSSVRRGDQGGDGEGEGDDEGHEAEIQHWRVDDHPRMTKQRVKAVAVERNQRRRAGWLEQGRHLLPGGGLPQAQEGALKEHHQAEKEGQGAHGDHDHPGKQLAIAIPLAGRGGGGKAGHQPRPEEQGARLSAPQGCDAQIDRHGPAADRGHVFCLEVAANEQVDQRQRCQAEQREGEQHGVAAALDERWAAAHPAKGGRPGAVHGQAEGQQHDEIANLGNHDRASSMAPSRCARGNAPAGCVPARRAIPQFTVVGD